MKDLQKRLIKTSSIEIRESPDGSNEKIIEGMLPYNSKSERMLLGYSDADYEVITPTAWNKTLADKRNIYLNYNHNSDLILASTKAGTMTVDNREDGLYWRASLPDTDIGNRAYQTIKRGDVSTLSFEFYPVQYRTEDNVSYITSGRLEAISVCVANPAYSATSCQARSLREQIETIKTVINKEDFTMDKDTINELRELLMALLDKLPTPDDKEDKVDDKKQADKDTATADAPAPKDERVETPEQSKDTQTATNPANKDDEDKDDAELDELVKELEALKKELDELKSN